MATLVPLDYFGTARAPAGTRLVVSIDGQFRGFDAAELAYAVDVFTRAAVSQTWTGSTLRGLPVPARAPVSPEEWRAVAVGYVSALRTNPETGYVTVTVAIDADGTRTAAELAFSIESVARSFLGDVGYPFPSDFGLVLARADTSRDVTYVGNPQGLPAERESVLGMIRDAALAGFGGAGKFGGELASSFVTSLLKALIPVLVVLAVVLALYLYLRG